MTKKLSVTLILIAILAITLIAVSSHTNRVEALPKIPDTPDAKQIMAVVNRAYQLLGQASRSFDISEFPSVFIDTDDYKLTSQQREAVAKGLGVNVEEVKNAGYLTAMRAKYISMARGSQLLQAAMEKAKA